MSQKTLLNYFTKSPAVSKKENGVENGISQTPPSSKTPNSKIINSSKKDDKSANKTPRSSKKDKTEAKTPASNKKRARQNSLEKFSSTPSAKKQKIENEESKNESEIEQSPETPPMKKRRRIIEEMSSEDDSGDEYVPEKLKESDDESESEISEHESDESPIPTESDEESPQKKNNKKRNGKAPKTLNSSFSSDKPKIPISAAPKELGQDTENWPHLKLEFLKPEKIRDAKRRLKSDPNYDPKTLYVPDDFKNNLTPAVRQWWEMKSKNFDIILFFKVGKFYELYHMDAVIAANELNLTFMRGEFAHVGFPEIAYGRFSATLVEKGYKVARVEQTETPDMMAERCRKMSRPTKFDKVVNREICQITSRGTRTFGIQDGATKEAESNFLLAIAEKEIDNVSSCYGVCFVDTSIGLFHIGQFVDDRHSSRLRTLIAHYPPVQVLCEKNHLAAKTNQVLNTALSGAVKDQLQPDSEFWSASKTLMKLIENYYKDNKFPKELNDFMGEDGSVNMICSDESELGVRALGAVVWYLQRCLIDYQLLTMRRFSVYEPIDIEKSENIENKDKLDSFHKHMVLDAVTLKNLNVLENSMGGVHGSLLHKLDNCCTPFGKRLLQRWICSPLGSIQDIKARQDAVCFLRECEVSGDVRNAMCQLPDLERLLSRIHSQGTNGIKECHPDTRAILFEEKQYSKRKIIDFISTINGFKTARKIIDYFKKIDINEMPSLVRQCCCNSTENNLGLFPELDKPLDFFENAFNHEEAQKEGRILPTHGTDSAYDEVMDNLHAIEKELKDYLKTQCAYFGCKVNYHGSDKKRYQLEVPDSASKRAKDGYELQSQRKGYKRYVTEETKEFLERMIAAEEQKTNVLKNLRQRIFSRFSEMFTEWNAALQCLAVLDVLLSFAEYSKNESDICVPKFVPISSNDQPFIKLIDGHYPCSTGEDVFIPNSTIVGVNDSEINHRTLLLVTGPNMGGKSTLMRQLGLIVIMAHMGCHVPAVDLELTLVDRVFTRLGANDDIMAGESTFYVELCETSSILQHATKHSLVLIDELGRGTSTYDGTAIASAVLNELCRIKSRTLFSTHYHSLVEHFKNNENVALGHMSCMVENENEDEAGSEETVTFLYKFAQGACPKSYGFNAARLAGMPKYITQLGSRRAKQLEIEVGKRQNFKKLFQAELHSVQELFANL